MKLLLNYNGTETVFSATPQELLELQKKLAKQNTTLRLAGKSLPIVILDNLDVDAKRVGSLITGTISEVLTRKL